jgi:uncharacterized protein (DUF362 family)
MGIDNELRPALQRKKYVLIKPNLTGGGSNPVAVTHADALRGILDYLAPRFKGPVVIGECVNNTMGVFEKVGYTGLVKEFGSQKINLVEMNEEEYVPVGVVTYDLHPEKMRMAKRLTDPDAFIISACIPKTHNAVVMTAAVKNMVVGGVLANPRKETTAWTDRRKFHVGPHGHNYNMLLVAQKMAPFWGVTVVDGYEGMEGDGPVNGTAVPHRIAFASTDFVAADRVATELMGIDPTWVGYSQYCAQVGVGNYDLARIDVRGETVASLKRPYRMHSTINSQLQWMGPMVGPPETGRPDPGWRGT